MVFIRPRLQQLDPSDPGAEEVPPGPGVPPPVEPPVPPPEPEPEPAPPEPAPPPGPPEPGLAASLVGATGIGGTFQQAGSAGALPFRTRKFYEEHRLAPAAPPPRIGPGAPVSGIGGSDDEQRRMLEQIAAAIGGRR